MKKMSSFGFAVFAVAASQFVCAAADGLPKARECLFPISSIRLTGGPLKAQQELNREYLLRLDPDRLLSRFRLEAGLKPKAEPYNGWESPKNWLDLAGHILGFYMAGAAMTYEATGDEELKRRLLYIVDELEAVQNAHGDGYALAAKDGRKVFDEIASGKINVKINPKTEYCAFINKRFEPIYTLNKVLIGLWRIHVATGSEKAKRVFLRLSDWFGNAIVEKLDDAQLQKVLDCEHASLPETFAEAFLMTGDGKYRRWARRLCHERMLAPLAAGNAAHLCFHHANNEIPKYTGFERVYRITGEERLHRAMVNANRAFICDHAWANGGNSHGEHLFPKADFERKLFANGGPESCNSVNMLRQTEALFQTEPSSDKMDYYERVLFDHLLSTHDPILGRTIYYTPPKPGASRTYSDEFDSMWCCTGTGFEAPGKYGQMVFTHAPDESAVSVQLFAPATLDWKARGVKLRQETAFPYGETTCVKVDAVGKDPKFTVKVRRPVWAGKGFAVYVNGMAAASRPQQGEGYVSIMREWKAGDRIDVEFPMSLRAEFLPGSKKYIAFFYGPSLLVGDLGSEGLKQGDYIAHPPASPTSSWRLGRQVSIPRVPASAAADPASCLERTIGGAIAFHLRGSDILLKPIYDLHFSRYTMYWMLPDEEAEKAFAEARAKEAGFAARVVDSVSIGDATSEKAHGLAGEKTDSGTGLYGEYHEHHWRHAFDGGFFAYRLAVGDAPGGRTLVTKYCARERGARVFDVLVDGKPVHTENLVDNHKPAFVFTEIPIPAELVAGKKDVEVRFVPKKGNTAGGLFGLWLLK
ncbi:MAG: glycoside hydrolase family 127 protein [Kiritimatiellae bacterium]|nr:glycoside hydrolase family 127 protein [Kiritimatiellia bacterium]